jgi:hypothetical protein
VDFGSMSEVAEPVAPRAVTPPPAVTPPVAEPSVPARVPVKREAPATIPPTQGGALRWVGVAAVAVVIVGVGWALKPAGTAPSPSPTPARRANVAVTRPPPATEPPIDTSHPVAPTPLPEPAWAAPGCPAGTVRIAGGTLASGGSASGTVGSFCLDRTEVRVADFRAQASGLRPTASVNFEGVTAEMHQRYDRYCTLRAGMSDAENLPVNCIDWDLARQYCERRGARLPTGAEWEFAARGPEGRTWPWGQEVPDATRLNACGTGECPSGAMYAGSDGFAMPAAVGSFAAGATPVTGLQDLAGNVAEWVSDEDNTQRKVRGGGFRTTDRALAQGAAVDGYAASDRRPDVGFRCAVGLP